MTVAKEHKGLRSAFAWICATAFALPIAGCVVADTTPVNNGYGVGYGQTYQAPVVEQPQPVAVASMPPDPLYEQMTPFPGYGFVWIDGAWHWNGYEWVWVSG